MYYTLGQTVFPVGRVERERRLEAPRRPDESGISGHEQPHRAGALDELASLVRQMRVGVETFCAIGLPEWD